NIAFEPIPMTGADVVAFLSSHGGDVESTIIETADDWEEDESQFVHRELTDAEAAELEPMLSESGPVLVPRFAVNFMDQPNVSAVRVQSFHHNILARGFYRKSTVLECWDEAHREEVLNLLREHLESVGVTIEPAM